MTIPMSVPRRLSAACLGFTLLLALAGAAPAPSRVVAMADVHGDFEEFAALLQRVGLIDEGRRWTGGDATFVQTGDLLDRGARSRECLDLVMDLQKQAPRDGGTVVPLLGNHEVMNVIGDLRYVTPEIFRSFAGPESEKARDRALKEYLAFLKAHEGHGHEVARPDKGAAREKWMDEHPPGYFEHREAFGPDGQYGRWIRSNSAVVQVGDGLFVHGGLNPTVEFGSLRELNERVAADLRDFDAMWKALVDGDLIWRHMGFAEAVRFASEEMAWRQAEGPIGEFPGRLAVIRLLGYKGWITVSADGPLWYRGLGTEPEAKLAGPLQAMLDRLGASYIVAGHSVVASKDIGTRFGSRVFLIDTGMLETVYFGRASALDIVDGRFTAHQIDRMPRPLPPPPRRDGAPPGMP